MFVDWVLVLLGLSLLFTGAYYGAIFTPAQNESEWAQVLKDERAEEPNWLMEQEVKHIRHSDRRYGLSVLLILGGLVSFAAVLFGL